MSGESKDEDSGEWQWAHILWQRKGLPLEKFAEMPRKIQLAYIASEELAKKVPLNASERLAKVYIKSK